MEVLQEWDPRRGGLSGTTCAVPALAPSLGGHQAEGAADSAAAAAAGVAEHCVVQRAHDILSGVEK